MIHTKEAYRLFLGRGRDPDRLLQPIIGGRRVAASLRAVWYLSGNDNPYADWALIDMTGRLDDARKKLDTLSRDCEAKLDEIRKRGLNISVLRNRVPKEVELGFKSPYGYTVAEHIITYDCFVRLVKTLVRKDLMSDDEGRHTVREITRLYRSIFETPVRFERYLMREELRPLSRSDFLPGATGEQPCSKSNIFWVPGCIIFQHGIHDGQQLSHAGNDDGAKLALTGHSAFDPERSSTLCGLARIFHRRYRRNRRKAL